MELTREQAINEFRRMWAWIAMETYGCRQKAQKTDYLETFGFEYIGGDCFLCEYDWRKRKIGETECKHCPIEFIDEGGNVSVCGRPGTAYSRWLNTPWWAWKRAVEYAWEIANLEEKSTAEREE